MAFLTSFFPNIFPYALTDAFVAISLNAPSPTKDCTSANIPLTKKQKHVSTLHPSHQEELPQRHHLHFLCDSQAPTNVKVTIVVVPINSPSLAVAIYSCTEQGTGLGDFQGLSQLQRSMIHKRYSRKWYNFPLTGHRQFKTHLNNCSA